MGNNQSSFTHRYGMLLASLSMFCFALVLILRSKEVGSSAFIFATLLTLFAAFLSFVYVSNIRK